MHPGSQMQSPQHLATDFTISPLHENKAENWQEQRVQTDVIAFGARSINGMVPACVSCVKLTGPTINSLG